MSDETYRKVMVVLVQFLWVIPLLVSCHTSNTVNGALLRDNVSMKSNSVDMKERK